MDCRCGHCTALKLLTPLPKGKLKAEVNSIPRVKKKIFYPELAWAQKFRKFRKNFSMGLSFKKPAYMKLIPPVRKVHVGKSEENNPRYLEEKHLCIIVVF